MFFRRKRRYKEDRKSRDNGMVKIRYAAGRGGEIADWTYGNVLTRVYRNRCRENKDIYFTVIQDRLYTDWQGKLKLSKSFYPRDLKDCQLGLSRAQAFLHERRLERAEKNSSW
jgi:hypothetical protein